MMRAGLCVTTALAVGTVLAGSASAADFTLRGFGGASFPSDADVTRTVTYDYGVPYSYTFDLEFGFDSGFVVGGAAGVQISDFTIEGELAYRGVDIKDVSVSYSGTPFGFAELESDGSIVSIMANGWYDIGVGIPKLSAYVGGGLGVGKAEVDFDPTFLSDFDGDFTFAWQLGTGVKYRLTDKLWLGGGVRYFQLADAVDESYSYGGYFFETYQGDYSDTSVLAEFGFTF